MTAPALDHLATLADPTRGRLLLVLEPQELTVGELCAVLQLPQSTVSRHLKVLGDEGWVESRAEGTSRYYRAAGRDGWSDRLWEVVREELERAPAAAQDRARTAAVLAARRGRSRAVFASIAGEWESVRAELFGARLDVRVALSLLDPAWAVGDLGCGTGHLAALLAPHVARVVAVDGSAEMLAAAHERLAAHPNVALQLGELERLPLADAALDVALLSLALPYQPDPARVVAEAARVVRPGGRVVLVDVAPHGRDDLQQRLGHLWRGFGAAQVEGWCAAAGLVDVRYVALPPDDTARGPALFTAGARRPAGPAPPYRTSAPDRPSP